MIPNNTVVDWTSHKNRVREVRTVTALKCSNGYIVKILKGLPGERNTYHTVPASRLSA